MIKVGLKIFTTDKPKILEDRSFADYFEVYSLPGSSASWLKEYDYEYIVHAPHASHGVNLASKKLQNSSLEAVNEALLVADLLDAKIIVVHPGSTKSKPGESDMETLHESLATLDDDRIVLENLPYRADYEHFFGYDYPSLKQLSARFSNRICLDFSHALVTSKVMNRDQQELINGLLKLDVRLFHMTDGKTELGLDQHLPLFTGNFDLESLKKIVNASSCKMLTLETPIDPGSQKSEYDWLKK